MQTMGPRIYVYSLKRGTQMWSLESKMELKLRLCVAAEEQVEFRPSKVLTPPDKTAPGRQKGDAARDFDLIGYEIWSTQPLTL